jgi:hypothetical protein
MDRQRSTSNSVPGILSVPCFRKATDLLDPSIQCSPRGINMENLELHVPGIERPDVFFLVCVGAFGIAFSILL